MTPEQERRLERVEAILASFASANNFRFNRTLQILDGRNIQTGRTLGTQIATASDQKLGFFGVTPVDQPTSIGAPSAVGTDEDGAARVAIGQIINALHDLGLIG